MGQKQLQISALVGLTLLLGTSLVFAAHCNTQCHSGYKNVQLGQQDFTITKQGVNETRIVTTLPSIFPFKELHATMFFNSYKGEG